MWVRSAPLKLGLAKPSRLTNEFVTETLSGATLLNGADVDF